MKEIEFRHYVLPLKNQLYRLALRITRNAAEAEDIVQEVFIKIWKREDAAEALQSIEAYAYTICRNLALDKIAKKETLNISLEDTQYESASHELSPDERLYRTQRMHLAQQLIDALPERLRTIIQLREIEEKSYKEIADIMALSEDIVKVSLHRARQILKLQLEKIEQYGL